jgi:hypothetical protein
MSNIAFRNPDAVILNGHNHLGVSGKHTDNDWLFVERVFQSIGNQIAEGEK